MEPKRRCALGPHRRKRPTQYACWVSPRDGFKSVDRTRPLTPATLPGRASAEIPDPSFKFFRRSQPLTLKPKYYDRNQKPARNREPVFFQYSLNVAGNQNSRRIHGRLGNVWLHPDRARRGTRDGDVCAANRPVSNAPRILPDRRQADGPRRLDSREVSEPRRTHTNH